MVIVRIICKRDPPTHSLTPSKSSPLSSLRVTSGPPSTGPWGQPKAPTQSHSLKLFSGFLLYCSQHISPLPNSGFPRLPTPASHWTFLAFLTTFSFLPPLQPYCSLHLEGLPFSFAWLTHAFPLRLSLGIITSSRKLSLTTTIPTGISY